MTEFFIVIPVALAVSVMWRRYKPDADACDYQETLASLRHYSALRFAMLTVFSAATAALVRAFVIPDFATNREAIRLAGLVLTGIFFYLEVALDSLMSSYGAYAREAKTKSHLAQRNWFAGAVNGFARVPLWTLYAMVFWFWRTAS